MGKTDTQVGSGLDRPLLRQFVDPWLESLADPPKSQDATIRVLVDGYARTEYGRAHGASSVRSVDEYRKAFPVSTYGSLSPYIQRVLQGDHAALLPEPLAGWVMTRGTTGTSKVLPYDETHIGRILSFGARAVVNFALRRSSDVLETPVLNLNFPSAVHETDRDGKHEAYGYSSGTYARSHPELMGARLVPRQEEVDSLGGGISKADWDARFELAYQRAKGEDIGSLMGVTSVMVSFADYLRRRHGLMPKKVWKPRALFCTSVAKIHTKYEPILRRLYGPSPVVEMYTATEGVFAQQLDDLPYVSPNYDGYLFEVATSGGIKMLHELGPNEWGRLVVSTSILPRYGIGDLVEALGKGYFRVFGRDKVATRVEHRLFNLIALRR